MSYIEEYRVVQYRILYHILNLKESKCVFCFQFLYYLDYADTNGRSDIQKEIYDAIKIEKDDRLYVQTYMPDDLMFYNIA